MRIGESARAEQTIIMNNMKYEIKKNVQVYLNKIGHSHWSICGTIMYFLIIVIMKYVFVCEFHKEIEGVEQRGGTIIYGGVLIV